MSPRGIGVRGNAPTTVIRYNQIRAAAGTKRFAFISTSRSETTTRRANGLLVPMVPRSVLHIFPPLQTLHTQANLFWEQQTVIVLPDSCLECNACRAPAALEGKQAA